MGLQLQAAILAEFAPGGLQDLFLMPGGFDAPLQFLPGKFFLPGGPIGFIHAYFPHRSVGPASHTSTAM
jgi:hypothetical protein